MRRVERKAEDLLQKLGIRKPPVDVEKISRRLSVTVKPMDVKERISGVLVLKDEKATVGYNRSDARVRQRFTIAHELGHYMLHQDAMQLFVDEGYAVAYRDPRSSSGEIRREREANAFAAAILMPKYLVEEEVEKLNFDLGSDDALKTLAKRFNVSTQAMAYRLANLGIFSHDDYV
jgi:Zn-dependent peptidase ImmA (M78 family)